MAEPTTCENIGFPLCSSVGGAEYTLINLSAYCDQTTLVSRLEQYSPPGAFGRHNKKMSPIKDLELIYDAINEENAFSEGDTVTGKLLFTLEKDTKVKSVGVKVKGRAFVSWTEGEDTYNSSREYFNVKQKFVEKNSGGTVLPKGDHCYKFSLKIPEGNMPSSFKGTYGYITYTLEARISRSWRRPTVEIKELKFASKTLLMPSQSPVSGSVDKGGVQMTAIADKQICSPGDTLSVTAKICNSSSKKMKPKFNLMQTVTYSAGSSNNHCCKSLCKVVGETIAPNSQETASCQLMVSPDAIYTLNNCEIVSVDYFIKVYLDIKFAIDPEVVLPLIIGPAKFASKGFDETAGPYAAGPIGAPSNSDFPPPSFPMGSYSVPGGPSAPPQPGQAFGAYPAGAFGAPGYSQFPPPSFPAGPYPAPTAPGTYGYPTPDPSQPKNQWLQ
ncbi:arrestin domain-containing protein 3-like isoform X1 [Halichoeres trimaculatus]|uniref:arrestin domain-containing protein 3-like isoform X1 n=1 Tax=Halichoeres trimaculatus TaxID=147232 RepID=UPI003D9F8610